MPGFAHLVEFDLRRRFSKKIAIRESCHTFACFQHTVAEAWKIISPACSRDFSGDAARDHFSLGMGKHASLWQHQRHIGFPAPGDGDGCRVANRVYIFVLRLKTRSIYGDPTSL